MLSQKHTATATTTFSLCLTGLLLRVLCDHITPVLQQRYWLPVQQRVVLVYKVLNNLAPSYLSDDCRLTATTGYHQVWSSGNFKCTVTCSSSRLGDQALAAAGPRLWNSLPTHVRRQFPLQTKNVFNCSRHQHLVTTAFRHCVQFFYLLLTCLLTLV